MTNPVIDFNKYINDPGIVSLRFSTDVAYVDSNYVHGQGSGDKHSVIVLKNTKQKISIVHPLSAFIFWKWKRKEYNTQRLQAIHLCQFLNYILIEERHKFRLKSLSDLSFNHGTTFLNHLLSNKRSSHSVKNIERTLVHFYRFLAEKGCASNYNETDFEEDTLSNYPSRLYTVTPFNVRYSTSYRFSQEDKNTKAIEHTLPIRYLFPFLRTALRVAPRIALGIYMSMFGGLRAGEVSNIRIIDLTPYGDSDATGGMKVSLATHDLRNDIRDTAGTSRVKRQRKQFVFNIKGVLSILYKDHMKRYHSLSPSKNDSIYTPLFINRDGKAMTGKCIRYHFNKTKVAFIQELLSSENPDDVITALNLQSTKWSFHIGRGIFTNLTAKSAKNPYEVALARGDRSIFSALTYMADTPEMKAEVEKLLEEIFMSYSI